MMDAQLALAKEHKNWIEDDWAKVILFKAVD